VSSTLDVKDSGDKTAETVQEISEVDNLVDPDDEADKKATWSWNSLMRKPSDLDAIATKRSVFDDPDLARYYEPGPDWENVHRYDPAERWTYREERTLRRKTDRKILTWVLVMFFALNIDRGNLSLALAGGLLDDLKVSTNDYNNAQNFYRVGFILSELPSQLIGKYLGPDRWIPIQILAWSVSAAGQFFMRTRGSFFATRFLIGICMGGFIPVSLM
jgi:hypothetical protein